MGQNFVSSARVLYLHCFLALFQVNELVLSVQAAQSKQQDEVDSLHGENRQLQSQLQASRNQAHSLAADVERTGNTASSTR